MWTFQRWMWKEERGGHERGIAFLAGRTTCAQQRRGVGPAMLMQPSGKSGERESQRERGEKIMGKRRMPGEQERLRTDKDMMGSTAAPWWAEPVRRHTHTPLSINLSSET